MYSNYVYLYDLKASGVNGGASVAGAWRTRDLNTEAEDTGNLCTLAVNQFTLQAGTYRANISTPIRGSLRLASRLYNITDAAMELLGTVEWGGAGFVEIRSFIVGRFTIAGPKIFEAQYRTNGAHAIGLGTANAWGNNIYTTVELWQET